MPMVPFSTPYLNLIGSYWRKTLMIQKHLIWIICDVTQSQKCTNKVGIHNSGARQQYFMCSSAEYINYIAEWTISVFPQAHMSRGSPDLRRLAWKVRDIKEMWVPGNSLLSESVIFLRKIAGHWQRCKVTHFVPVQRFTYDVIGQWPDLTWKLKVYNVRLE